MINNKVSAIAVTIYDKGNMMINLNSILIWLLDFSSLLVKILLLSAVLFYFWADVLANAYIDISSQICTEYSSITNKEVKYFDVVGCFEKNNNNWVKVN